MVRLRCTQRVLKRFRLEPKSDSQPSTTRLGDWYANLFNVGRARWVLCVSERVLLPVILPARKDTFPSTLAGAVHSLLLELEIPGAEVEREVSQMARIEIERTRSRRVLGVMNDFSLAAQLWLRDGVAPEEVALKVAQTPSKPVDYESPERVARALLASHRA